MGQDKGEVFLGIVLEVRDSQCLVRCSKRSFGIHELEELESERDADFFDTVYSNDGYKPTLKLWKHFVDDTKYMELKGVSDV